jgi:hypothetical protein
MEEIALGFIHTATLIGQVRGQFPLDTGDKDITLAR